MPFTVPFYIFKGPEFGEKNDALQDLKNKAKKNFSAVEFSTFYATETPVLQVISVLANGALFSDARFVVFKNAELIKTKDDIKLLQDWVNSTKNNQISDSILVLITDENSVDKKLEALAQKENVKMFWEMFENRKIPWITDFFRKNGFKIEQNACEEILNLVENNTEALRTECSRFFVCFKNDKTITINDVDDLLSHNREENPFTLYEAMCDAKNSNVKRLENSLEILQKIMQSSTNFRMASLSAGLLYSFRQLKKWKILKSQGVTSDFDLKRNGFASIKARSQCAKADTLWNLRQTEKIIALISETDMKLRSIGRALEKPIIENLLYEIIMKNGNKILAYKSVL